MADIDASPPALFCCTGVGEFELGDAIEEFYRSYDRPVLTYFTTRCGGFYMSPDNTVQYRVRWHKICNREIIGFAIAAALNWFRDLSEDDRLKFADRRTASGTAPTTSPNGWILREVPLPGTTERSINIMPAWV